MASGVGQLWLLGLYRVDAERVVGVHIDAQAHWLSFEGLVVAAVFVELIIIA